MALDVSCVVNNLENIYDTFDMTLVHVGVGGGALLAYSARANSIANNVLIIDHVPESEWSWYCCETEKIERSWKSMENIDFIESKRKVALQTYDSYEELRNKLPVVGDEAINRIKELKGKTDINIEMPYRMVLI